MQSQRYMYEKSLKSIHNFLQKTPGANLWQFFDLKKPKQFCNELEKTVSTHEMIHALQTRIQWVNFNNMLFSRRKPPSSTEHYH